MSGTVAPSGRTWDDASTPEATQVSREYQESWRRAGRNRPTLGEFLARLRELGSKSGVQLALFRTDMSLRWENGQKVAACWYLEQFPDLPDDVLVALVYEEFCLREEGGENPAPDEFYRRYPTVSKGLARILEIHGLVGSGEVSVSSISMGGQGGSNTIAFPEVGQTIAGFHLVEELGRGAFARVFLAHERQLADRPVALKVTRKGSREPQTLARLQHTHIVPVYSHRVDPATGLNLLCMPYFGRITLAQILTDLRAAQSPHRPDLAASLDRLAPSDGLDSSKSAVRRALASRSFSRAIAWWGARLAEALQHAHDRGVLHRDLKPSNVLVTADGMPMLLDFNLAREPLVEGEEGSSSKNLGGTIDYMAPEHLEALTDSLPEMVDGRSDIFGLGVVLFECVMGERPYAQIRKRGSMTEAIQSAVDERRDGPPRLRVTNPEIPPALETVIRKCLQPVPKDRYQSGDELAADLQAVADDRPLLFARQPLLHRLATWARHRRRRLITAASILATLVLIFLTLGTVAVQRRLDLRERLATVSEFNAKGEQAYKNGDFSKAVLLFGSAIQLSDARDWRTLIGPEDRKRFGGIRALLREVIHGYDDGESIEMTRFNAELMYSNAAAKVQRCEQADALHRRAEDLRFRLIGLGDSLGDASKDLQDALEIFRILPPVKITDWTKRADIKDRLDDQRYARLTQDVNELMFLWVSQIDISLSISKVPDPRIVAQALDLSDRALAFVGSSGPWKALRSRLEGRRSFGSVAIQIDSAESPKANVTREVNALNHFSPREPREENSALTAFQWGVLYFQERQFDEAIRWLERAVHLEARNYWYHFYLAFVHDMRAGNDPNALVHYNVAADLNSNSPWIPFCRARFYSRNSRNWARAIEDLQLALHQFQELYLEKEKEVKASTEVGEQTAKTHGSSGGTATTRKTTEIRQVWLELGLVYQAIGDDQLAHHYFREVIRMNPGDSFSRAARLNLANGQAVLGRTQEAMAIYADLLSSSPSDQPARRSRALVLLREGNAVGAEADLTFLIDLGDRCHDRDKVFASRALARLMQGSVKADDACHDAEEAWKLNPIPSYERLRQRSLLAAGNLGAVGIDRPEELALYPLAGESLSRDLRSAVIGLEQRMRKGIVPTYSGRLTQAIIFARLNERAKAEMAADTALKASPDSPHALMIRARTRLYAGNVEGASSDMERGLIMFPSDPGLLELKSEILMKYGRAEEALLEIRNLRARGIQEPSLDCLRARAHTSLGHHAESRFAWTDAIRKDSQLAEAHLGRGQSNIRLGNWSEAVFDLSNAFDWANSDLGIESRSFMAFTRCLAHNPALAGRWLSMGWRVISHSWLQWDEAARSG